MSQQANKIVAPWDKRGFELEDKHGTYSHYVAWEEWFTRWNEQQPETMQVDIDIVSTLVLYSAFTAAFCQSVVEADRSARDNERARKVITTCDSFCDITHSATMGFVFQTADGPTLTASDLRIIADELDRRNKAASDAAGSEAMQ